jgi:hypothetical protein
MDQDMANIGLDVTTAVTTDVIARLDRAIHHFQKYAFDEV